MGKTFHHLKFTQRKKIKEMLDMGIKKTEIAHSLGVHTATIYREIERGSVDGRYDPDYAENIYKRQLSEKGMQPLCIISPELAEYIAKWVRNEKLMNSPSNWFLLSFKCTRHSGSRVKTPGPLCLYSSGIQKLCWCHNHRIFYAGL